MISEKKRAEKLDKNNQKRLQNIVGKFLYYDRAIDPKILIIVLNSLAAVHKKPTIETAKQITEFSNYRASYPDEVT